MSPNRSPSDRARNTDNSGAVNAAPSPIRGGCRASSLLQPDTGERGAHEQDRPHLIRQVEDLRAPIRQNPSFADRAMEPIADAVFQGQIRRPAVGADQFEDARYLEVREGSEAHRREHQGRSGRMPQQLLVFLPPTGWRAGMKEHRLALHQRSCRSIVSSWNALICTGARSRGESREFCWDLSLAPPGHVLPRWRILQAFGASPKPPLG